MHSLMLVTQKPQRKVEKRHKVEEVVYLFRSPLSAQSHLIRLLQGFRIDLTCKQLTVDFVNQSVLQMSSHDVEGKRSDKTDFAEKLGAMNRRWQILQGLIGEKVTLLGNETTGVSSLHSGFPAAEALHCFDSDSAFRGTLGRLVGA